MFIYIIDKLIVFILQSTIFCMYRWLEAQLNCVIPGHIMNNIMGVATYVHIQNGKMHFWHIRGSEINFTSFAAKQPINHRQHK